MSQRPPIYEEVVVTDGGWLYLHDYQGEAPRLCLRLDQIESWVYRPSEDVTEIRMASGAQAVVRPDERHDGPMESIPYRTDELLWKHLANHATQEGATS